MKRLVQSVTSVLAVVFGIIGSLILAPQPVGAWCNEGLSKWSDPTQTLQVWHEIPSAWWSAISSSRAAWNNIDTIYYAYPQFNSYDPGDFNIWPKDFSAAGWDDVPGATYNTSNANPHVASNVYLNTDWTWNTTGSLDPNHHIADVRTITTHEFGHSSGLAHPYSCDPPYTSAEKAAVMWVDWTKKWTVQSDDRTGISSIYP